MENEYWKYVDGWDNRYSVSNFGRLKSFVGGAKKGIPQMYLKTQINSRGYEKVSLQRKDATGKVHRKKLAVHRLVCIAFHPNPENKPQVNHKDCNPLNNHKDNLEWCTAKENTQHAMLNGRMDAHWDSIRKVTEKEKNYISENYEKIGTKRIAEDLGISVGTVIKYGNELGVCFKIPTKRVIDINTNIIYSSPEELAIKIGVKVKELRRRLSDERPNNTPYRYINWYGKIKEPKPFEIKPKYITPRIVKPIAVFDMEWNELKRFKYIGDAALFVDGDSGAINEFLNGKREQHKGHKFKLLDENGNYIEPIPFVSKRKPKKVKIKGEVSAPKLVEKYNTDGKLLETYGSVGLAAKAIGADKKQFRKQIAKSPTGYCRGYNWKVID